MKRCCVRMQISLGTIAYMLVWGKVVGQTLEERGLIWFSELSALLDDGYNLLMTFGNMLALISCWYLDVYLIDDDSLINILMYICEMIRSSCEHLAQVQGDHMLLIMHCWHYLRIFCIDSQSCFLFRWNRFRGEDGCWSRCWFTGAINDSCYWLSWSCLRYLVFVIYFMYII